MKWRYRVNEAHVLGTHTDFTFTFCDDGWGRHVVFDLNDASLCVQEMQKQEDYLDFILVAYRQYDPTAPIMGEDILFFAWLMTMEEGQAKNFFAAFTEWRKGK
jgi:hypothetical protein